MSDAEVGRVGRCLFEDAPELLHRLLITAHALQRHDLAGLDREDRLDVQEVARERRGLPDPSAFPQELERVDGEEETGVALEALDEGVDPPRRSCRAPGAAARRSRAGRGPGEKENRRIRIGRG